MSTVQSLPIAAPLVPRSDLPWSVASNSCTAELPGWVCDLDSFRRWARSEEFPRSGWFAFLGGTLWVELSMEQVFTHNQIKTRICTALDALVHYLKLGYFFSDHLLYTSPDAGLCTE